jgi:OPA family glycerol-3-phosphate transporter-like MFS transporter
LFGYVFGTVGASSGMGYLVKAFGWDAGFYLLLASCVIAIGILAFTWNFRAASEAKAEPAPVGEEAPEPA